MILDKKTIERNLVVAKKYKISPEDGVESYSPFHLARLRDQPFIFNNIINKFEGVPELNFLEVGSFEGLSAAFFLKNVLTHKSCRLTCIDPHGQKASPDLIKEGWGHDPNTEPLREKTNKTVFQVFENNILSKFSDKVTYHRESSHIALRKYYKTDFDLIYLDGLHYPSAILSDIILSWPLLKKGGYLLLDDFGMQMNKNHTFTIDSCFFGISAFLGVFQGQFKILSGPDRLIALEKTVEDIFTQPSTLVSNLSQPTDPR